MNKSRAMYAPLTQGEHSGYPIVCVGASAGGMEAIHEIFDNIPQNTGMAFVVIQHLSSDHKSLMAELLSRHTTMKVVEAGNGTPVLPDTVYVIPHNKNIIIRDGALFWSKREEGRTPNMAIDLFLQSLAADVQERSIAVILSGTGTDGTRGIAEIKKAGGLVFVQDPATARFDGMPYHAIASGKMDFVLSPESIAEELLMKYPVPPPVVIVDSLPAQEEPLLMQIFSKLKSAGCPDFTHYKRPTIIRRLTRRMAFSSCKTLNEYANVLETDKDELLALGKEFLVGVTKFFRDPEAFDELKANVIPEIIRSKALTDTVKIWVTGCSTGEEAYSIAMLIKEYLTRMETDLDVKIFASDVSKEAIDFASKGCYSESIVSDVPHDFLGKYFIRDGARFRIAAPIRKMIVFSLHDVLRDPPYGKIDLISCRNMMIYVSPAQQRRMMAVFHFSLNLGGYLWLGPSESIGDLKNGMLEVSRKWKIYKNTSIARPVGLEALPFSDGVVRKVATPPIGNKPVYSLKGTAETILNNVLEECAIAGALVDADCNIIETFGDYRKYLHLPDRKFDHNILKMVPAKVSIALGTNFRKAMSGKQKHVIENIRINEKLPSVSITIKPVEDRNVHNSALIFFNDLTRNGQAKPLGHESPRHRAKTNNLLPDLRDFLALQDELKNTREILQKAIEDADTTNEELQSSNEELISSNEELQSANEELQSLNEELHTVNAENQARIKEISELNDDLNNYFISSNIGQVFLDRQLRVRKFTPSATALVNLIDSDIGRPIVHISNNIPYDGLMADLDHVLHHAEIVERTVEVRKDVWYQMKMLPYLRDGRHKDGVVLLFVDITQIKVAERIIENANQELKTLNEHLTRSNRELEQFAYITSHDLQEPLRKIQTFADLTSQNLNDTGVARTYLEKIISAAIRMSLLIRDVLSYSRLTLSDDVFAAVDLSEVCNAVINDFDLLISQKRARIVLSTPHTVKGIPLQLQQLFSNLVSNSLKFCEKEPEIQIRSEKLTREEIKGIEELSDQHDYVKVTFADNGIGFDQQYADKIFTIFQRLNHRKLYAGTGIGLALCKRIVENHGGAIRVKSAMDCGATFEIFLPSS